MIRILTIWTFATISFSVSGQNIDSLGIDKSDFLNGDESVYLNDTFIKKRGNFNFEKKKIGFFVGSTRKVTFHKRQHRKHKRCVQGVHDNKVTTKF
jgi:hypothetical protein